MNYFQVSPGDLKKQFQDLSIYSGTPLAWDPNLGNVSSGYNDIVIASKGSGAGFPHALAPYTDQSTFAAYAQRYTDGGYGPLNTINTLGENIAPNFYAAADGRLRRIHGGLGHERSDGIQIRRIPMRGRIGSTSWPGISWKPASRANPAGPRATSPRCRNSAAKPSRRADARRRGLHRLRCEWLLHAG